VDACTHTQLLGIQTRNEDYSNRMFSIMITY